MHDHLSKCVLIFRDHLFNPTIQRCPRKDVFKMRRNTHRPGAQQADQQVATEAGRKHLGDDIQVWHQGRLENNGNVGSIEQLDRVGVVLAPVASRFDRKIHSEALKSFQKKVPRYIWTWTHTRDHKLQVQGLDTTRRNLQLFCASTNTLPRGLSSLWKPFCKRSASLHGCLHMQTHTHTRRYERFRHWKKSEISRRLNKASRKRNIKTSHILQQQTVRDTQA